MIRLLMWGDRLNNNWCWCYYWWRRCVSRIHWWWWWCISWWTLHVWIRITRILITRIRVSLGSHSWVIHVLSLKEQRIKKDPILQIFYERYEHEIETQIRSHTISNTTYVRWSSVKRLANTIWNTIRAWNDYFASSCISGMKFLHVVSNWKMLLKKKQLQQLV